MPQLPPSRSVKIGHDERTGWSSDGPRRDGKPPRAADLTTRCRVLTPSDTMRYSPGSLLLVASASTDARRTFVERLIPDRAMVLSADKVRGLLAGRVPDDVIDEKAAELLDAAVRKRLTAGESVVIPLETLDAAERERFVRVAAGFRRPRHLILLETARSEVDDQDVAAVGELRQAVDTASIGSEGIQTAMRLGGGTISALKRIMFRPAPQED